MISHRTAAYTNIQIPPYPPLGNVDKDESQLNPRPFSWEEKGRKAAPLLRKRGVGVSSMNSIETNL